MFIQQPLLYKVLRGFMCPTAMCRGQVCLHIGLTPYTPLIMTTITQFTVFLREIICQYCSSLLGLHDLAPMGSVQTGAWNLDCIQVRGGMVRCMCSSSPMLHLVTCSSNRVKPWLWILISNIHHHEKCLKQNL